MTQRSKGEPSSPAPTQRAKQPKGKVKAKSGNRHQSSVWQKQQTTKKTTEATLTKADRMGAGERKKQTRKKKVCNREGQRHLKQHDT